MSAPIVHIRQIPNGRIRLDATLARNISRVNSDAIYEKTKRFVTSDMSRFPIDHPLIDTIIRQKSDNSLYVISRVYMMYDDGYYIVALYEQVTGSIGQVNITNLSCPHAYANQQLDRYEITDMSLDEFFGDEARDWYDRRKLAVQSDIERYVGVANMIIDNH